MVTKYKTDKTSGEASWSWEDSKWQKIIDKVRAGRSLKPKQWKNGARVAVALSFDSDHETTTLRWADDSPGRLSQGQYGGRVAIPRIREVLSRYSVPASFFVPAKLKKYILIFLLFVYPIIGLKLISGGDFGLKYIETGAWGGLSLTFIVSSFALILCFPIGMFLALGRRSNLPAIR